MARAARRSRRSITGWASASAIALAFIGCGGGAASPSCASNEGCEVGFVCLDRQCVDVRCSDERPCSAGSSCSTVACVAGECVYEADDTMCRADERCSVTQGCVAELTDAGPVPMPVDGGGDARVESVDAGAGLDASESDAGVSIEPTDAGAESDASSAVDACVPTTPEWTGVTSFQCNPIGCEAMRGLHASPDGTALIPTGGTAAPLATPIRAGGGVRFVGGFHVPCTGSSCPRFVAVTGEGNELRFQVGVETHVIEVIGATAEGSFVIENPSLRALVEIAGAGDRLRLVARGTHSFAVNGEIVFTPTFVCE